MHPSNEDELAASTPKGRHRGVPSFLGPVIFTIQPVLCKFSAKLHVVQDTAHAVVGRVYIVFWQ